MEYPEKLLWLIGAAVILFIISFIVKKTEWLINFALRGIMGIITIYFINIGITYFGFHMVVGINGASALVSGVLGIPGIIMLYGLSLYQML